ncbi:MAG: ABC transporter permease [Candidatus Acidiferrales bacterium]
MALQALRANKVRAGLTMLGVIIGSMCIVMVVTIALAGKRYIISQIEAVGSNMVYAELQTSGRSQAVTLDDQISEGDLAAIERSIPQVIALAGSHKLPTTIVAGGAARPVNLVGVTSGFDRIRNLQIVQGRFFDDDDEKSRGKVCLTTQALADLAFLGQNPVGKSIRVGELDFTVIGEFRERAATFGETEITKYSVLVPFPLVGYYTGENYFITIYAQADGPEDVPLVTQAVKELLKNRHRPGVEFRVQNLTGILETARSVSFAMTVVLLIIASVALLISGIGIMNIMLVTVTERTHEIGIRKAIGASRSAILYQFLSEAVLISATGAVIGILLAVSIPLLLQSLLQFLPVEGPVHIPVSWVSVVLALFVSCSTGLIFGYLPANRAARLQPTDSLRME